MMWGMLYLKKRRVIMEFFIKICGERACFSRPEFPVEKFTYPVITPSAARGILESVYWKPEMRWVIDKIKVMKKVVYETIKINGTVSPALQKINNFKPISTVDDRRQYNMTCLKNVEYIIYAHIELTEKETSHPLKKHEEIAYRRLSKGQKHNDAYLGFREFPASVELITEKEIGESESEDFVIGPMLYDIDYTCGKSILYVPEMKDGVIIVPEECGVQW